MSIYSIGRRTTNTTSGQVAMDIGNNTGVRARIQEWQFFLAAATASVYGLNRPSTLGTRTSPVALLTEDPGEPALTGITLVDTALAHSAQPTLATDDLRRIGLPATIGTGIIWQFPLGLLAAISLSIALVNRGTNGVGDSNVIAGV